MRQQLMIKMALDAWNIYIIRTDTLFNELTDEQLAAEVAPGRNTGVYLLGHLAAVHDAMLPLFGLGEKLYPLLEEPFIKSPDKSGLPKPATKELRKCWLEVNTALSERFNQFTVDDWFQKHAAVATEDFAKEPHRNKLNVLMNRTNHLANHLGQLVFLKK